MSALSTLKSRTGSFLRSGFRPLATRSWEWALMRLFFAIVVWDDLQDVDPFRANANPTKPFIDPDDANGIARVFDLEWISHEGMRESYLFIAAIAALAYVLLGRFRVVMVLSTTVLLSAQVIMRTAQNSHGAIYHSHQLIGLILLAHCVLAWVLWIRSLRRQTILPAAPNPASGASLYAYYSLGTVAASYVIAAVAKFANSTGLWVWNSPYISFDLIKSERQEYYKALDPAFQGGTDLATWVLEHPWISRLAFGGAFWLELLALLALKNRRWALGFGLALIALHVGIWFLMHLEFDANLWCLLIFVVNVPWWVSRIGAQVKRSLSR